MEEGFFPAEDGTKLYWRRLGEGPATLVVPNATWLEKALEPLARGRTLLLYDLRSRGRSERPADSDHLGLDWDVRDVESIGRAAGLSRFSLLGHSYVGSVAAIFASRQGSVLDRLVMIGAPAPHRQPGSPPMPPAEVLLHPPGVESLARMRREGVDRTDPERFARAFMTDFLLPFQVGDPAAIDRIPLDACRFANESPDHWIRLFAERIAPALAAADLRPAMKNVTAAVLVVHGEKEKAPLEGAHEWVASFPNARLLVVPGAGHAPFSETPDAFFPPVETFLSGGWPGDAIRV